MRSILASERSSPASNPVHTLAGQAQVLVESSLLFRHMNEGVVDPQVGFPGLFLEGGLPGCHLLKQLFDVHRLVLFQRALPHRPR